MLRARWHRWWNKQAWAGRWSVSSLRGKSSSRQSGARLTSAPWLKTPIRRRKGCWLPWGPSLRTNRREGAMEEGLVEAWIGACVRTAMKLLCQNASWCVSRFERGSFSHVIFSVVLTNFSNSADKFSGSPEVRKFEAQKNKYKNDCETSFEPEGSGGNTLQRMYSVL